jgi:predicted transcriptional regulator
MASPHSTEIWKQLKAAGVNLPDDVTRIVIDVQVNQITKVYYETNASCKMMDVVIENLMQNKDSIEVIDVKNIKDKG